MLGKRVSFRREFGELWESVYVDNEVATYRNFAFVLRDVWVHVHAEATLAFNGRTNLMASHGADGSVVLGNLRGCLTDLYVWDRALLSEVRDLVYSGFNYLHPSNADVMGMVGGWPMEEGQGNRVADVSGQQEEAWLSGVQQ